MRGVVGESVPIHAQAGYPDRDDFESRRKTGGDADAFRRGELIDADLDKEVADRNEAVLQDHRQRKQDEKFENTPRKEADFLFGRNLQFSCPAENKEKSQQARGPLRNEGRSCNARNAPRLYHEIVQHDVGHRRKYQKQKGRLAVAQRRENTCSEIVQHQKGQPVIVNVQICNALVHRFLRRLQRIQGEPAGNHSRPHQHDTENSKRDQRRIDGRLDVCIVLFPEIPGGKHRAPRIRPQRKRHQDIHDRIGGADRRQSRLPRKTPGNDRVRQRVQLLKDRAAEQRQRIFH